MDRENPKIDCASQQAMLPLPLQQLLRRASVATKTLVSPGPTQVELETIIAAALTAPDHGALRPFRFIRVDGEGRQRLAHVFMAIKTRRDPKARPQEIARTWKKTMLAPCLLAIIARIEHDHPKIPAHEQFMTVGAAIMGVLVASQALGYGAITLSGRRAGDPLVRELLRVRLDETVLGFISIGTPIKPIPEKARPHPRDFLSSWSDENELPT